MIIFEKSIFILIRERDTRNVLSQQQQKKINKNKTKNNSPNSTLIGTSFIPLQTNVINIVDVLFVAHK
jgi:hypothetical protein